MSKEALKLALEALEEIADEVFSPYDNKLGGAILALRQAIEQAEQAQPVAWAKAGADWLLGLPDTPLEYPYFTNGVFKADCQELAELLQSITSPPPRQPLTDEQIEAMWQQYCKRWKTGEKIVINFVDFARAIEAAHGIGEKK